MAQHTPSVPDPTSTCFVSPPIPPFPTDLRPLPDCEGPKLEAFTGDLMAMNIEFLDLYVGDDSIDAGIAKIKIDGKLYCLKMFMIEESSIFREPMPYAAEVKNKSDAVKELMRVHTTPFYNECRAFGRLKELGIENLAVRVHGYAILYPSEKLTEMGRACLAKREPEADNQWFYSEDYLWRNTGDADHDKRPVMCILKDWVDTPKRAMTSEEEMDSLLTSLGRLPRLLGELHQLHQCGIVNRDLRLDQYVNGMLVDFSRAWTIPHILGPDGGVCWPSWAFASMAAGDLQRFQDYVIEQYNARANWFNEKHGLKGRERLPLSRLRAYPSIARDGIIGRLRRLPHREAQNLAQGALTMRPGAFIPYWREGHQGLDVQGPLFPLFTDDGEPSRSFIHWPRHDPAKFDWKAAAEKAKVDVLEVSENKARKTGRVASKRVTKRKSGALKQKKSRRTR